LVGPQPVDAAPYDRHLGTDPVEKLAQRPVGIDAVGVRGAVDTRQQLP
jgi:hypothetical protein